MSALEELEMTDVPSVEDGIDFYEEVSRYEVRLIQTALRHTNGSQKRAARLLKLNPTTLNTKIKFYEIDFRRGRF